MNAQAAGHVIAIALVANLGFAQTRITPTTIEVSSVRPSDPAKCREFPTVDNYNDRVAMMCVTTRFLVQLAYGVRDFQILGGPGWFGSAQYDIAAKAERSPDSDKDAGKAPAELTDEEGRTRLERLRAMLQPLLAERYKLTVHQETKQLPVYLLTVAQGGPKLKSDESASGVSGGLRVGRGLLAGSRTDVAFLAQTLSQIVGRPILDQTGLKGKYDFELKWTPDQSSANSPAGGALAPVGPDAPPTDPDRPTIFTAIREQLGLRLASGKGPVEVIVVDRVERPGEN